MRRALGIAFVVMGPLNVVLGTAWVVDGGWTWRASLPMVLGAIWTVQGALYLRGHRRLRRARQAQAATLTESR